MIRTKKVHQQPWQLLTFSDITGIINAKLDQIKEQK